LVRNEIFELRNESKRSFAQSITSQIEVLLSGSNISFEIIGKANIKGDDEYELLRSIRELILNSIAHSNCQNIKIELSDKLITYSDDGQFVDSIKNNNYGLIGLQERLTKLGGSLRRLGSTYEIKLP
jgi:signal transduction histidine kinase